MLLDDEKLADFLWERLKPLYAYHTITDEYGDVWQATGLNSRFRITKYDKGGLFKEHDDGYWQPSPTEKSFATAMVYLNTVLHEDRGDTFFTQCGLSIQPVEGMGCFFLVDGLSHRGEPLLWGNKYLLRSDVMYVNKFPKNLELITSVYNLKEDANQAELDGDIDKCGHIWDTIFKLEEQLSK
jgi:hypothetical protein